MDYSAFMRTSSEITMSFGDSDFAWHMRSQAKAKRCASESEILKYGEAQATRYFKKQVLGMWKSSRVLPADRIINLLYEMGITRTPSQTVAFLEKLLSGGVDLGDSNYLVFEMVPNGERPSCKVVMKRFL